MKILLVSANRLTTPYPVYPLGVDYVAGILMKHHHIVRVLDLAFEPVKAGIESSVRDFQPDMVGLSLRNIDNTDITNTRWFIDEYTMIADTIRASTDVPLVLGGAGFTLFARELVNRLNADFGFYGEGEFMGEFADRMESGRDVSDIPGLVIPDRGMNNIIPWKGPFSRGLDALSPEFYLKTGGMLNIQTKRGCPYHCVYCTYPSIEGRNVRLFPPLEVSRTARELQDKGAKYIFVADAVFNTHPKHNLAVAKAMRDAGVSIPWGAFFSPLAVEHGYYEELAGAGLTHVEFGTESMSDTTLAAYGKSFRVKQVFQAHEQALAAGLHVAHYFMPGGPGETPDTLRETLENVNRLKRTVAFFFCGVRIYPGTELYNRAIAEGQISPDDLLLNPVFYRSPQMDGIDIDAMVIEAGQGRDDWIVGAGGERTEKILAIMYRRGHTGPLWEKLIR